MQFCDTPIEKGAPCPGHLAKFESCRDEALYELVLSGDAAEGCGDSDLDGHFSLIELEHPERVTLDVDTADARVVLLDPGCYIVHSAPSGAVWVTPYAFADQAREAYAVEEQRYLLWERGCDLSVPAEVHEACDDFETCQFA